MTEKTICILNQGKNIIGMIHLPENQLQNGFPVVIMSHGFSGDKIGPYPYLFVFTARELAKHGFAVIRFDFTGNGESEGVFEDQNLLTQQSDLSAVIDFGTQLPEINKNQIFLLGHSRGGAVSIMQTAQDTRIKGLITWATPAHWNDIWAGSEETFQTEGYITFSNLKETKQLYDTDMQNQPRDYAAKVSTPWLIIHGQQDGKSIGTVSPEHAKELHNQDPTNRTLHIIETANHYFYSEQDRHELWQTTTKWLKQQITA